MSFSPGGIDSCEECATEAQHRDHAGFGDLVFFLEFRQGGASRAEDDFGAGAVTDVDGAAGDGGVEFEAFVEFDAGEIAHGDVIEDHLVEGVGFDNFADVAFANLSAGANGDFAVATGDQFDGAPEGFFPFSRVTRTSKVATIFRKACVSSKLVSLTKSSEPSRMTLLRNLTYFASHRHLRG